MTINRFDLKHNFLRRIIMRLDYSGVVEVTNWLEEVHKKFPDYGFVKMSEEYIQQAEFELQDPVLIANQLSIPLKEIEQTPTYKYASQEEDMILEINKYYTSLVINAEKYKNFEYYSEIFSEVALAIKQKNSFLKPLRLGLRKINDCIVKEPAMINNYFSEQYFPNISLLLKNDLFDSELSVIDHRDTVRVGELSYNFNRFCSDGILEKPGESCRAYQVVIDIDGYSQANSFLESSLENSTTLKSELETINNKLFNLYALTLSTEFINKLKSTQFTDQHIEGVRNNDSI